MRRRRKNKKLTMARETTEIGGDGMRILNEGEKPETDDSHVGQTAKQLVAPVVHVAAAGSGSHSKLRGKLVTELRSTLSRMGAQIATHPGNTTVVQTRSLLCCLLSLLFAATAAVVLMSTSVSRASDAHCRSCGRW